MKKSLLSVLLCFFLVNTHAQDNNTPAIFPGGDSAWSHYLDTSFNSQNMAKQMTAKEYERFGKTQRVVYTFNVLSDGTIGLINIEGQVSQVIRNEIYRVLRSAPRWTPATLNGKLSTYRKRQISTFTFD
ncbi:MAG: hypothetical protein JWQ30_2241, partial [Sediminibacterium sp.]|nr:hypothetical protein [Sediminibacterium sp.]